MPACATWHQHPAFLLHACCGSASSSKGTTQPAKAGQGSKGTGIVLRALRDFEPQRGRYSELIVVSMRHFGGCSLCAEAACAALSDCQSLYALLLAQGHKRRPTMSAGGDMGAVGAQDARQAKVCKLADIAARVLFRRPHALDQHIGALQITAQARTSLSFLFKLAPQSRSLWGVEGRSQAAAHSLLALWRLQGIAQQCSSQIDKVSLSFPAV